MPINKNALLRYQILDRCFSDRHRYYEIEDLVDKVNFKIYSSVQIDCTAESYLCTRN